MANPVMLPIASPLGLLVVMVCPANVVVFFVCAAAPIAAPIPKPAIGATMAPVARPLPGSAWA